MRRKARDAGSASGEVSGQLVFPVLLALPERSLVESMCDCVACLVCCRDSTGLVGPIRESEPLMTESLPECEAGCDIGGLGDMVDFVRQWAQVCHERTTAFSLLPSAERTATDGLQEVGTERG